MTGEITHADLDDPDIAPIAATGCAGCLTPLGVGRYVAKISPECGFDRGMNQHAIYYFHARHAHLYECEEIGQHDDPSCKEIRP